MFAVLDFFTNLFPSRYGLPHAVPAYARTGRDKE